MLFFELGSSPIDVVDPSWELYVLIQRKTDQQGEIYNMLLGFTAVYRFYHYPDSSRLRIGQVCSLYISVASYAYSRETAWCFHGSNKFIFCAILVLLSFNKLPC